ncbi:uncharacterized protein [Henckelia pumila]|uniref:uncharacterized protein n=1 Tax=Henckelia pumila TaxID=405737 RepID=UPI003C6E3794
METQIGQLANALKDNKRGQFPSNTEVNPIEHCKVIELRSGKRIGAEGSKYESERSEGTENLKIHINVPFSDVLEQIPYYETFIKEEMSKKRRLQENKVVNLTEECSAILQKNMPQKLKDPGSFTIPCSIGGAQLSIYRVLELGEVKPATITLQLADRSIAYPRGVVEDVLVKVDKFIFSAYFVILDMEEDHDAPLIFGRPCFATADVKIDVKNGELTMGVEGEKVIFNIFKKANNSSMQELFMIDRVEKFECRNKDVSEVENRQRIKSRVYQRRKIRKKKEKFKKRFVEYVWRVKEKGKAPTKVTTA